MLRPTCVRRSCRGFSMIELVVVLAIIAMLTLVAAPWFLKVSQHNTVKSAAREVSIALAAARIRAVKRNLASQVLITPASGTQSFNKLETFEMTVPTPTKVGEVDLTASVKFLGIPQVFFGPDGRATNVASPFSAVVVRGVVGNSVTNDVSIQVSTNGHIQYVPPSDWR